MSDDQDEISLMPVLEAPPTPEMPEASASFIDDGNLVLLNGKLLIADSIVKLLTKDLNFRDFTRELLLLSMKVIRSEVGSILEINYEQNYFFFRAVAGRSSDTVMNFTVPLGQGIVGFVADSRQPLVVSDANENRIHLKAIDRAVGFETRNLVAAPIVIRGKVFGVLELINRVGETDYTSNDIELVTYFCELASKAIELRMMINWLANGPANPGSSEEAA